MLRFVGFIASVALTILALTASGPEGVVLAGPAAPIIGAVGGGLASGIFGGDRGQQSQLSPEDMAAIERMRMFGGGAAQMISGFDPITGQFGAPGISGPLVAPFGAEQIQEFFSPYQDEVIAGLQEDIAERSARAGMEARQLATASGTRRGGRAALLEGRLREGVERAGAREIAALRHRGFFDAANLGLAAQPIRSAQLQEPLMRLQAAHGFLQPGPVVRGRPKGPGFFERALGGAVSGAQLGASIRDRIPDAPGPITVQPPDLSGGIPSFGFDPTLPAPPTLGPPPLPSR